MLLITPDYQVILSFNLDISGNQKRNLFFKTQHIYGGLGVGSQTNFCPDHIESNTSDWARQLYYLHQLAT